MEKLRSFFESKWAVLLAFVPVVQVFYFFFAFLVFRKDDLSFRIVGPVVFVGAGFLTHLFLPWGWLAAYICLTVLALVSLKAIRNSDYQIGRSFWIRLAAIAMLIILSVVFALSSPFDSEKEAFLKEQTRSVLEAVINNDPRAYKELEYWGSTLSALDGYTLVDLRRALMEKDSLPEGEIGEMTLLSEFMSGPRASRTYTQTYEVVIGDGLYRVKVEYTEASGISGFSRVDITKIG